MTKRVLALILVLLTVIPMLFACGQKGEKKRQSGEGENPTVLTTAKDESYKGNLVKEDFGGAEVTTLILPDRQNWSFCAEEPSDTFDIEIYRRNGYVEQFYNVILNFIPGEQTSSYFSTQCQAASFSDSSEFDIVSPDYYYGIVEKGYFIDMAKRSEINLEAPYWVSGWNESTTINGKNYAPVGYLTLDPVAKAEALFSNDSMADRLGIPSIYETVKEGEWTLEKLNEYIALAAQPDGDTNWTFNSTYGLCANLWSGRALMVSCGYQISSFENGKAVFSIMSDKNIKIFEEIYKLFNSTEGTYYCGGVANSAGYKADGERDTDLFMAGRALFLAHSLSEVKSLGTSFREDYSAYPMPKFDSDQKEYRSTILGTSIFGVMKNAKNIHMSCTLLDALCAISYEDVLTVYYDKLLRSRYSQNRETAEMMDLIRESVWVDFLFINSSSFDITGVSSSAANAAFDLIAAQDNNFASGMKVYVDGLGKRWGDFKEFYD